VSVKDKELCRRYQAIVIDGVKVGPSPWWLQKRLLQAGHRPYNNIVDITNYVLHEYGQPMHTFDYSKLEGGEIIIRKAKKGEKFLALDENEYKLSDKHLVVADSTRPVAVAGVMGGQETGTTEKTTTIVFECASFEPVNVRRTARDLNLYSDSQLLFEKGLSVEATEPALMRAIELTLEISGGRVASQVFDERCCEYKPLQFPFDPKKASELIGVEIPEVQQMSILGNLGFTAKKTGDHYMVTVPYWRDHDVENSVDFTEEIARIYGYHNMPSKLPDGELPTEAWLPEFVWERKVKQILAGAGATEAFSESFISEDDLVRYGLTTNDALHLKNPLSSDLEYLRPNLIISMLRSIEANQREFSEAALFELARTFVPKKGKLPDEAPRLLLAAYASDGEQAFLRVKGMVERLFHEAGVHGQSLDRGTEDTRWHTTRSATISINDKPIGVIGEISRAMAQAFGLEARVALVDLDFKALLPYLSINKQYTATPDFPVVKRDLAFVLDSVVEYYAIESAIHETDPMIRRIELFDVYSGKGVEDGQKSLAIHLEFRADDRTLKSKEVDEVMNKVIKMIETDFSASVRQ
jgi:phenylalanyl-tRNA synthetase beta chain